MRGSGGSHRHAATGRAASLTVDVLGADGESIRNLEPGEPVTVRVQARAERQLEDPVVGVLIRNR